MASALGTLLAQRGEEGLMRGKECCLGPMKNWIGAGMHQSQTSNAPEHYHIVYHETMRDFVDMLCTKSNGRDGHKFTKVNTKWDKFTDGADYIQLTEVKSPTHFKGKNILFVASFHNNDATMSQYHVIAHLCESLAKSLTVLLPYYNNSTMERMDINKPTEIPTANTIARLFNGLPSLGYPIRIMTYDLHTLQNRFYVTGHAIASLHTATTLMVQYIQNQAEDEKFNILAFPDAGAHKRFADLLKDAIKENMTIICGKERDNKDPSGVNKKVNIQIDIKDDPQLSRKRILIVDDILKSGGTFLKCASVLKAQHKSAKISVFTTHSVLADNFTETFNEASKELIDDVYTTNSIPNKFTEANNEDGTLTTKIHRPRDKEAIAYYGPPFHVLDLTELVLDDL
jgi:phosphoribosylpyrophosphate synthetase